MAEREHDEQYIRNLEKEVQLLRMLKEGRPSGFPMPAGQAHTVGKSDPRFAGGAASQRARGKSESFYVTRTSARAGEPIDRRAEYRGAAIAAVGRSERWGKGDKEGRYTFKERGRDRERADPAERRKRGQSLERRFNRSSRSNSQERDRETEFKSVLDPDERYERARRELETEKNRPPRYMYLTVSTNGDILSIKTGRQSTALPLLTYWKIHLRRL